MSILDSSTFVVSDRRGDIDARPDQPLGLFFRDTRFLSLLTLGGLPLEVLSTDDVDYSAQFFLVPPRGTVYRSPALSVIRQRFVGDGLHDDLVVLGHAPEPIELKLGVEADADFADLFEVKDELDKKGERFHLPALVLQARVGPDLARTPATQRSDAVLPENIAEICLTGIPGRWGRADVEAGR